MRDWACVYVCGWVFCFSMTYDTMTIYDGISGELGTGIFTFALLVTSGNRCLIAFHPVTIECGIPICFWDSCRLQSQDTLVSRWSPTRSMQKLWGNEMKWMWFHFDCGSPFTFGTTNSDSLVGAKSLTLEDESSLLNSEVKGEAGGAGCWLLELWSVGSCWSFGRSA